VVVTLGDDLEGELGLRRVHGEDGEVVDGEQLGGEVATEDAVEAAMELGAVEIVEQARSGEEEDPAVSLAGAVGEGAGEEGLAGAGGTDEERIDPLIDKGEVVKGEITVADLFASGIEIEIESVDGVDLGEASDLDAALDGVAQPARPLLVEETVDHLGGGEILLGGEGKDPGQALDHAGEAEPAQLFAELLDEVLLFHGRSFCAGSSVFCSRS
jgi:hypothetical protein